MGIRLTSRGTPPTQRTTTLPPVPLIDAVSVAGVVAVGAVAVGRGADGLDDGDPPGSVGAGSPSPEETARSSGATALRTTCTADQETPRVRVAATTQAAAASGPVRMAPSSTAAGRLALNRG